MSKPKYKLGEPVHYIDIYGNQQTAVVEQVKPVDVDYSYILSGVDDKFLERNLFPT